MLCRVGDKKGEMLSKLFFCVSSPALYFDVFGARRDTYERIDFLGASVIKNGNDAKCLNVVFFVGFVFYRFRSVARSV